MKSITSKIIIGGVGGQGVLTLGKLLAYAGMGEKREVSCLPSYGAEMRGGYAFCTLIISTEEIFSPVVSQADIGIFMDRSSLEKFKERIEKNGTILINSSLIKDKFPHRNLKVMRIPATKLAEKIGDVRVANIIMAGALLKILQLQKKKFLSSESLKEALKEVLPAKPELINLNKKAIEEGEKISFSL
ncbi:MAG: 2-oxoacid:ferredoxin oxidoreductase subunit gamma [bacterium (Candidatus Ratteibacteria) CG_4_10_14_3_um_filter_41_18]|uniref:2-oxoacid:ferredoxin oxidoreductase subunit gamma n=3 Tax=Candidatus Ratteibacteria TaxID=2979319 RepID=A0A2M7YFW8_9BACT|nr:MAG: 2-oxoacid:ferredoxin oxidoreductase subunit gamma [bacterium (Candidatus Ratteibacteria) CG01_land_8_20_14_3_00_40_19]PIX77443.1 MAG: 2-oxoacid:ferredoxin oxidoreductase subunit gamma [bacterium (Candidatus Ratteibacteria) CG_4_10_14_3_um_filter_41_18]PJA61870.1 MAG: 2-oxoacid:ferredoxin oxidoreductase subunit gamma [bacterium (Candidatus Ratteibacteria) CG_4_9_14_3_um_filter_41_21]